MAVSIRRLFLVTSLVGGQCVSGVPWSYTLCYMYSKQIYDELCGLYGIRVISMRYVLGGLTLKAPSIICSRRDFQTLLFFYFQK